MPINEIKKNILSPAVFLIFSAGLLFALTGLVFVKPAYAEDLTNLSGWGWVPLATGPEAIGGSPIFGWLSLNCYNTVLIPNDPPTSTCANEQGYDYGLKINPATGDMSGYIWNGVTDTEGQEGNLAGLGYISFDTATLNTNFKAEVGAPGTNVAGQIAGWARIKSLKDAGEALGYADWGWIELGEPLSPDPSRPDWWMKINFDYNDCYITPHTLCPITGYAWSGGNVYQESSPPGYNNGTTTGFGWIYFGDPADPSNAIAWWNPDTQEVSGWAWVGNNDKTDNASQTNIGWISLNSSNPRSEGGDYRITIDPVAGTINGFGWIGETGVGAGNLPVGWVDFAPTKFPSDPQFSAHFYQEDPPAYEDPLHPGNILYDYEAGDIAGWARIMVLKDEGMNNGMENWGWVKLHSTYDEENRLVNPLDYGLEIDFTTGQLTGCVWSGGGSVDYNRYDPNVGIGWICFGGEFGSPPPSEEFNAPPTYVPPYLKTTQGDIYSKTRIGGTDNFVPPNIPIFDPNNPEYHQEYNSTFLIQSSGDIVHFISEEAEEGGQPRFNWPGYSPDDPLSSPLATNRYTNAMGKLDVVGITSSELIGPDQKNKFNNTVMPYLGDQSSSVIWDGGANPDNINLNQKVYHVINGDLTIDAPLVIKCGDANNLYANGTIVVDENLIINSEITYEPCPSTLTDVTQIPSVAWIVKGRVIVNATDQINQSTPTMQKIAGAFIVIGKDDNHDGQIDPDPINNLISTGLFSTGNGTYKHGLDEHIANLEIDGLVIARDIHLERVGINDLSDIQPSEKIEYDGRVIINTPPGLTDFAAGLPVLREVAPIEVTP